MWPQLTQATTRRFAAHWCILPCDLHILKLALFSPGFKLTDTPLPTEVADAAVDPLRPLLVVDVDEVLAMFMRGFEQFLGPHGYEMRITRFALFQNIYRLSDGNMMDLDRGRELFNSFFEAAVAEIEPAPGATDSLARLAEAADVVILTNAPRHGREPRTRWLARHGFPYPMIINSGPKGPVVAALAARTSAPTAFVDDLLMNLDSVADAAPKVLRFQHVADERLRPFAPSDPARHPRIDNWPLLADAIAEALGLPLR